MLKTNTPPPRACKGRNFSLILLAVVSLLLPGSVANATPIETSGNDEQGSSESVTVSASSVTYPVTIVDAAGSKLTGQTIEFRRIARIHDSQLTYMSPNMQLAAQPLAENATELFSKLVNREIMQADTAKTIWEHVQDTTPDMTHVDAGVIDLQPGLWVANLADTTKTMAEHPSEYTAPVLVYAGETNSTNQLIMLTRQTIFKGNQKNQTPSMTDSQLKAAQQPSLVDRLLNMFSTRAISGWVGGLNWSPSTGSQFGDQWNFDFQWKPANGTTFYRVFCAVPGAGAAAPGSIMKADQVNDNAIRTVLFYGNNGPASIYGDTWNPLGRHIPGIDENTQLMATHFAVAHFFNGFDVAVKPLGMEWLVDLGNNHKLSWKVKYTAFRMIAKKGSIYGYYRNGNENDWVTMGTITSDWDSTTNPSAQVMFMGVWQPGTINVTTQANASKAVQDRTSPITDSVYLEFKGDDGMLGNDTNTVTGWPAGMSLTICLTLNHRPTGTTLSNLFATKCAKITPKNDYSGTVRHDMNEITFQPSDKKWTQWETGLYWFDTRVCPTDSFNKTTLDCAGTYTMLSVKKQVYTHAGGLDAKERFRITELEKPTVTGTTQAYLA